MVTNMQLKISKVSILLYIWNDDAIKTKLKRTIFYRSTTQIIKLLSFSEHVNKGLVGTQYESHTARHLQEETGTLPDIITPHRVVSAEI